VAGNVRVVWNQSVATRLTVTQPALAGAYAAKSAALLAARAIRSKESGALARDVGNVQQVGMLHWRVGSSLPYARIEHFGGVIQGNPTLYISGRKGLITATASSVQHKGKGYLSVALKAFPALFLARMKATGG